MSEPDVLRGLYAASYRRLVAQLTAITGDLAEAEDVVQEAFVRAINHRRTVEATDNPEAWVRRVAVNLARSRWRRGQRFLHLAPRLAPVPDADTLNPDALAVLDALRRLSPTQREAIALHHLADLSVRAIADLLGVAEGTVKARLSRGRAALGHCCRTPRRTHMSERELEALARGVHDVAAFPGFDRLLDRAHRRRRRQQVVAVAVTVLVVASSAAAATRARTLDAAPTSPDEKPPTQIGPSGSGTPSTSAPDARALVDDPHVRVEVTSADRRGDLLAVYEVGDGDRPRTAVAIRTVAGRTQVLPAAPVLERVDPLPDGWYLPRDEDDTRTPQVLASSGRFEDPVVSPAEVTPRNGDVPVDIGNETSLLTVYRPGDAMFHPVAEPPFTRVFGGVVTSTGVLVAIGNGPRSTARSAVLSGGRWRVEDVLGAGVQPAAIGGTGHDVAIVGFGQAALSDDDGATWRTVAIPDADPEAPASVILTPDGTALLAVDGRLLRVRPGHPVETIAGADPVELFSVRNQVYARLSGRREPTSDRLVVSDDDGDTWRTVPLPGRG